MSKIRQHYEEVLGAVTRDVPSPSDVGVGLEEHSKLSSRAPAETRPEKHSGL